MAQMAVCPPSISAKHPSFFLFGVLPKITRVFMFITFAQSCQKLCCLFTKRFFSFLEIYVYLAPQYIWKLYFPHLYWMIAEWVGIITIYPHQWANYSAHGFHWTDSLQSSSHWSIELWSILVGWGETQALWLVGCGLTGPIRELKGYSLQ